MASQCFGEEGDACIKVGRTLPVTFQLVQKSDGALTLQGYYPWECGSCRMSGGDWVDIPTVKLPAPKRTTLRQKFSKVVAKLVSSLRLERI